MHDLAATRVTSRWSGVGRTFGIIGGVVLAVAGLKLGEAVLLPLVLGGFLAVLVRPLQRRLRDALPRGLRWLGLVVAMLALLAALAGFTVAVTWSARAVATEVRERRSEIAAGLAALRARAARVGIALPGGAPAGAQGDTTAGAPGAPGAPGGEGGGNGGYANRALRSFGTTLTVLGLALGFAALGLAEADELRRRLRSLGEGGARAIAAVDEAAPAFRRYVWVKSLTSLITGLATALAALAFGLPLAWVWGFIAFLLEYVPSVGSVLAVIPPTLAALAEGGTTRALAVLLTVGALQVVLGNVVDPKLEGRLMAISPLGVLLSIVFWGWLWGAIGALLAVPLTVAFVVACRHIPGMHGVATMVAGDEVDRA